MKILVLGAGGPAGVNTCRALRKAGHYVIGADSNESHLNYLPDDVRRLHMPEPIVNAIIATGAHVVIPQPDALVRWLASCWSPPRTFLPALETIERCQDKLTAATVWRLHGLRRHAPISIRPPYPDWLHTAADEFGTPYWLRKTRGAGAAGAVLVTKLEQAYHWLRFWASRDDQSEWMAEEYLPGRDLAWASIWHQGQLVTSFARQRLEYIYPHLTPEGLTGTPTIARVIHDDRVNEAAVQSVLAIDPEPHGIFSVDLREDAYGMPRPTEINAGRGFTTLGLWSLYGPNFMDIAVRLAADGADWGSHVRPNGHTLTPHNALPEGLTLYRHIDCGHTFRMSESALPVEYAVAA
jgi:carbamoyl-phosphate synthase large subunit